MFQEIKASVLEDRVIDNEINPILDGFSREKNDYVRRIGEIQAYLGIMTSILVDEEIEKNIMNTMPGLGTVPGFENMKKNDRPKLEQRINFLEGGIPEDNNLRILFHKIKNYIESKYKNKSLEKVDVISLSSEVGEYENYFNNISNLIDYISNDENITEEGSKIDVENTIEENISFFIRTNYFGKEITNVLKEVGGALIAKEIKNVRDEINKYSKPLSEEELTKKGELIRKLHRLWSMLNSYKRGDYFSPLYQEVDYYKSEVLNLVNKASGVFSRKEEEVKKIALFSGYLSEIMYKVAGIFGLRNEKSCYKESAYNNFMKQLLDLDKKTRGIENLKKNKRSFLRVLNTFKNRFIKYF